MGHQGRKGIRDAIEAAQTVRMPGGGGEGLNLMLAELERNDVGNAQRFLGRHGQDVLFVRNVGWHVWTGAHWSAAGAEDEIKRRAHETARSVLEEVDAMQRAGQPEDVAIGDWRKRIEDLFKWSLATGNRARLEAMVAEAAPYVSVPPEDMDADPLRINLRNGTLDMSGACDNLRPHRREDRQIKVMPVDYDPDAVCPLFLAFLEQVQPDPGIRSFIQVWAGYCMTGVTKEQKLVFNYGEGGNGKSVFIDLVARIMGPYAVSLPFASLLRDDRKRGAEATPDLARLPGARLVRASEPEKGARFAEATIKSVTGGEEVTVRHLNQGFFDFAPQFKITLSGNHKPSIRGQDRGIWRRFLLVPWVVNLPDELQDKDLPEKLWEERSGVLNWLLDGVRIWLERGLVVPAGVRAATDEYRADSDPVGRFLSECVEQWPGESVQASVMYEAYKAWCGANAERPWTMTTFGRALPERGVARSDGRIRVYTDVRLVNVPDASDGPPPPNGPDDYV